MGTLVEKQFPVKTLLTGLRAIGYSFATAVADIIDNSISAKADTVYVYSDPIAEIPFFCILDDGCGMSFAELNNAMMPGSDRTDKEDCDLELGRFGLGLKSASLSQCREFIVASKRYGKINAMAFDLDVIEDCHLLLKVLDKEEICELPYIEKLHSYESGTLVVWNKFDKIESTAKSFEDSFRSVVAEAKKHVEFVFHRFYDDIEIFFNNKRIERRDPFLLSSLGRQQTGRTTKIIIGESIITVTPYTLPFANSLSSEEKDAIYKELTAQVEKIQAAGITITHADSHHHIHTGLFVAPIAVQVCKEHGINKIRLHRNAGQISFVKRIVKNRYNKWLRTQGFITTDYFAYVMDIEGFDVPDNTEIMIHPDYDKDGILIDRRGMEDGIPFGNPIPPYGAQPKITLRGYKEL